MASAADRLKDPVLAAVAGYLAGRECVPNERIVVAYSGGIDSTVLLHALVSLEYRPHPVYVDHRLRDPQELEAEKAFIGQFCRSIRLEPIFAVLGEGAVTELARGERIGIEAAARSLRYAALESEARKIGAALILTAHNLDDNLETLLARVMGGAGPDGLAGIKRERPLASGLTIGRPLLGVTRREIERYATARGLAHSEDSTNASLRYHRNRIRNLLIPVLDEHFEGWRTGLLTASGKLAERLSAGPDGGDGSSVRVRFDKERMRARFTQAGFEAAGFTHRRKAVLECVSVLTRNGRVSSRAIVDIAKALGAGLGRVDACGVSFRLAGGEFLAEPLLDFQPQDSYFFTIQSEGSWTAGEFSLHAEWSDPKSEPDSRMAGLLEGSFSFPLIVRSRKPGDRLRAEEGSLRVDDVLASLKVERGLRDFIPIASDREGVAAVLAASLRGSGCAVSRFRKGAADPKGRHFLLYVTRSRN